MSAQRRIVTILFADVVGSTAIGEELDPEDLSQLLAHYYASAREVIEAFGGTIEKFIGDAVMAIFGFPQAHDDDAERAIAAGLELRERVRTDPRLGERLPIRIGINTGEVATRAGDSDHQPPFVAGDAVNVAARLQQQAEPWSIVVGDRTARAAAVRYAFGAAVEVAPRGRSSPVAARVVVGERVASATQPPFVGRDSDMEQLDLVARRAFAEHRPSLVTIVAPPGTGKTRLLQEFLDVLAARRDRPLIATARCLPYGQQVAYQPLRGVVDSIVGAPAHLPADDLVVRLQTWLRRANVADAQRTGDLIAATLGLGGTALPVQLNELHAAWRTFLEAAAEGSTFVLAIEDLHWASDSLLDLIDFAMQPHARVPALVIASARPELFDRRAVFSSGRHNQTTIELAPLEKEAVGRIVVHLLPEAGADTVASVVERADGNPFFALEISRSFLERAGARDLPDTVQATIQARLDRLEAADRLVMDTCAVFDRPFATSAVAALTGLSQDSVSESTERLVERGLLVARGSNEFAASHILIRDVGYAGLSRVNRAALHRALADYLVGESAGAEPQSIELIAVHYREAALLAAKLDNPPPDLLGVADAAVAWLLRAAASAIAFGASSEAVEHLQAALAIARPEQQSAIYEQIGDANLTAQTSLQAYKSALELSPSGAGEVNERLNLAGKLLLLVTRSWGGVAAGPSEEEMQRLLDEGAMLEHSATDDAAVARFLIGRAFVPFWSTRRAAPGERAEARNAAQRGLEIARRVGDPNLQSAALDALGSLAETWPAADAHARERLLIAERLELAERVDAHSTAAWAACVTGLLSEADGISARGLAPLEAGQVPSYALHLVSWRIGALRLLGQWNEFDALGVRAVDLWEATGRSAAGYATRGFADLLEVARATGDSAAEARYVEVLDSIYAQFPGDPGTRRNEVLLRPTRDSMARYLSDEDTITSHTDVYGQIDGYERVLGRFLDEGGVVDADLWQRIADTSEHKGCRVMRAQALRAVGLARSSVQELSEALKIATDISARPLAARVMIEIGRIDGDRQLIQHGAAVLADVGDAAYLKRLRESGIA
jgi:class 3 adenylate cyclase